VNIVRSAAEDEMELSLMCSFASTCDTGYSPGPLRYSFILYCDACRYDRFG
jgi:hypothetical protein